MFFFLSSTSWPGLLIVLIETKKENYVFIRLISNNSGIIVNLPPTYIVTRLLQNRKKGRSTVQEYGQITALAARGGPPQIRHILAADTKFPLTGPVFQQSSDRWQGGGGMRKPASAREMRLDLERHVSGLERKAIYFCKSRVYLERI